MKVYFKSLLFSSILFLSSFFSFQVKADFKLGVYKGLDQQGQECSIEFVSKTFAHNFRHPLNELVNVNIASAKWAITNLMLKHPVEMNRTNGEISFTHDFLDTIEATKTGARALSINLKHDNKSESGPQSYIFSDDHWKNPENSSLVTCSGLIFQETTL